MGVDGREIEARLAAIVSSSDDAIISKTLDGHITSWNASAERIFGYTAEEMIGAPITTIIPHELLSEEHAIIAALRRGERVEHFETVRLTKTGERLDLSITVSPMRDPQGNIIGASKVARDIRERKRAQQVQRLLIDELNHRIKNTLATVQAIAQQTLRRTPDPQAFTTSFTGRIRALARAHGLLTGNSFQSADLSDIVREQLAIVDRDRARISYSGPMVRLGAQPALHLALVLHELSTNAHKHGALSAPNGIVRLRWSIEGEDARRLELIWEESGGAPVTPPTKHGFGATLIEQSLIAHGSDVRMEFRPSGLICTISLPLPRMDPGLTLALGPAEISAPARLTQTLAGKRILIVEDEPLIAMTLRDHLEDAGCLVVGPAHTLARARALVEAGAFDAVLLDGNLSGDHVDEIAARLDQIGAPFVFVTGYGREALPAGFGHARVVEKPFTREQVAEALLSVFNPNGETTPRARA